MKIVKILCLYRQWPVAVIMQNTEIYNFDLYQMNWTSWKSFALSCKQVNVIHRRHYRQLKQGFLLREMSIRFLDLVPRNSLFSYQVFCIKYISGTQNHRIPPFHHHHHPSPPFRAMSLLLGQKIMFMLSHKQSMYQLQQLRQ